MLAPWKKSYVQPRQHIKKQTHYFTNKGPSSQSYGFSSSHVWMWELDYKESWAPKYWCFWTVVLEKTLESPLDCKEIQPVHPKGNQSRIFIGRTDAEAETPILCTPDVKNWLIGKDSDTGRDWGQEEKQVAEDEMVRQHHWFNGYEFEQTLGDSGGQGSLACCNSCGCRESDMLSGRIKYWKEVVAVSRMGQRGNKIHSDSSSSHSTKGWKGAHPASAQCRTPPYKVMDKQALYPVWWLQGAQSSHSSIFCRASFPRLNCDSGGVQPDPERGGG